MQVAGPAGAKVKPEEHMQQSTYIVTWQAGAPKQVYTNRRFAWLLSTGQLVLKGSSLTCNTSSAQPVVFSALQRMLAFLQSAPFDGEHPSLPAARDP